MNKILFRLFILITLVLVSNVSFSSGKLKVLIVTGGHDFDKKSFFEMFDSFKDIGYKELTHPNAYGQLDKADPSTFDAVVFYDMPATIIEEEKDVFYKLVKEGKGLLFLHHSICSLQDWMEYESFTGGKYYEKKKNEIFGASSYQHDVRFVIHVVAPPHPVTAGMKDFEILDEVYGNLEVLPDVQPLLSTDNPKSNKLIGWAFKNDKSRIVYIEPGHDKSAFFNPSYQQLIQNAIAYVSAK
jgi:uncharacterized protein